MPEQLQLDSEPGLTQLVTGIISDAQELLKQQLAMFKAEIKEDLRKTKEAALALGLGIGITLLGGLLLVFMLVYLLQWSTALPLWACYAIVGGALTLLGGILLYSGTRKLSSFNPLPDQSAEAVKENVQWLTSPK